jgi:hypothetical protein
MTELQDHARVKRQVYWQVASPATGGDPRESAEARLRAHRYLYLWHGHDTRSSAGAEHDPYQPRSGGSERGVAVADFPGVGKNIAC